MNPGRRKTFDLELLCCIRHQYTLLKKGEQHLSNRNTQLISILCIFNIEMPVGTMFLHVPFDVSPKHLLFTIRTGSIFVFSQVLKSDVPFAVGLVGEGSFTSEAGISPIVLTQTKLVCCLQQSRCKRVKFHGEF